jgi:hypothetical protein
MKIKYLLIPLFLIGLPLSYGSQAHAANRAQHESTSLELRISTRTPQQIGAFYEARGFQKNMIAILKQQCFVTVFIKNKSDDFIWLDLSRWDFTNEDGTVTRYDRQFWKQKWQTMDIPLAHQATFRWTLLPERLDFHPNEREGGNIILPRLNKPFDITAQFPTGADGKGLPLSVNFKHIECAENQ